MRTDLEDALWDEAATETTLKVEVMVPVELAVLGAVTKKHLLRLLTYGRKRLMRLAV